MTWPQIFIVGILCLVFAMFLWGRWRYDVIAFGALILAVILGVVEAKDAFAGFGHPATVTVAVVLILSRALSNTGAIDIFARLIAPTAGRPSTHIASLAGIGAVLSSFMNNVGALALLMPVGVQTALKAKRAAGIILMLLSFGTILGGLVTLIGTPPNIIVAAYRGTITGTPFSMFDYAPVGAGIAVAGIAFVALIGWRLIPRQGEGGGSGELFDIDSYLAEVRVPEGAAAIGQTKRQIRDAIDDLDVVLADLIRGRHHWVSMPRAEPLQEGDILVIQAPPEDLDKFVAKFGLEILGAEEGKSLLHTEETGVLEVVVMPRLRLDGRPVGGNNFKARYGVNLLGLSRQGQPHRGRLRSFQVRAGDVLLLHGEVGKLPEVAAELGCLPLADRQLAFGKRRQALLSIAMFAVAIVLGSTGVLPLQIALGLAALGMVVTNIVPPRDLYDGVDWPVIVLLGAMIPIGGALEQTGATALLVETMLSLAQGVSPVVILVAVLVVTMTLSDVLNNAATAVVMAPIGATIADRLGVSADPFLMAVAIGASCAFLTPIGHQNNALVMGPGGYRFGDYWRMGLPLEIIVTAVAVPLILIVWPLN